MNLISLLGLAYGFLSQSPRFLFGNRKHLIKVLDIWSAVEILKIHRQVWIFTVLRMRDVYPGSRILIFTHPGSRIQK
jgi:hypothetical protein